MDAQDLTRYIQSCTAFKCILHKIHSKPHHSRNKKDPPPQAFSVTIIFDQFVIGLDHYLSLFYQYFFTYCTTILSQFITIVSHSQFYHNYHTFITFFSSHITHPHHLLRWIIGVGISGGSGIFGQQYRPCWIRELPADMPPSAALYIIPQPLLIMLNVNFIKLSC